MYRIGYSTLLYELFVKLDLGVLVPGAIKDLTWDMANPLREEVIRLYKSVNESFPGSCGLCPCPGS